MSLPLRIGQVLKGHLSSYEVVKHLYQTVDGGAVYASLNGAKHNFIIKTHKSRVHLDNEAALLRRYQPKSSVFCTVLDGYKVFPEVSGEGGESLPVKDCKESTQPDESGESDSHPFLVLGPTGNDLLSQSIQKRLSRYDIKYVVREILEALQLLHNDGLVHNGIRLDNIFAKDGLAGNRFSKIRLGDCGSVVPEGFQLPWTDKLGPIGAKITDSPEAALRLPLGPASDIWSLGNAIISLLVGGKYNIMDPANEGIKPNDSSYGRLVLFRMNRYFGPFPSALLAMANENSPKSGIKAIGNLFHKMGPSFQSFRLASTREIPTADMKFLLRLMNMDPNKRPSATELLRDPWFKDRSEDTRDSYENSESPSAQV
ncbi:serine/threonine protein kinase [Xylaria nigripes]|nr:serine/threonine protein kinase [Xylaria nigripes]